MKFIKNMLAKPQDAIRGLVVRRIVKKVVKLVSKNNPYALAAVELYGLYDMIKDKQDGSERKEK